MPNFTKKAIKDSFIKLLNERPLSQITVKDIVEDCGINRNTFYYHFDDLPSLLKDIIKEDAENIIEKYPSIDSMEQCFDVAIRFALENRKAVLHMFNSVNRDIYEHYLTDVCNYVTTVYVNTILKGKSIKQSDKEIFIRLLQCEFFGQIISWMSDGMKDDVYERFHRLSELCRGIPEEIIRRSSES